MPVKTTYRATTPDGTVVTFTSTRAYTHAIWVNGDPARGEAGQGFVRWTANPAAALKSPGQSGDQSRYFRSLGHGLVELEIVGLI